jgi:integrase
VRLFVTLALNTGARSGAILGLTWRQVDLEHRIIDFGVGGPGKERAAVPINDELLAALEEARAVATSAYVVEYAGGRIGSVKRAFAEACARAGVKDCRPHDLRRTAGSWMLQRGVPIGLVSAMLGHRDVRTTQHVYAHLNVEHLRTAAEALGRGWKKG